MNRSLSDLVNCVVRASDGDIGAVRQFYFDDYTWTIRYMVMNTVYYRPGQQVLIATVALDKPQWQARVFPVNLTRLQVRNSPNINTAKPVSRQHEVELFKYYGWPVYWGSSPYAGVGYPVPTHLPSVAEEKKNLDEKSGDNPHLRSTDHVTGYYVHATDGEIGHVHDYIVDDGTWKIRYIVVKTRNWWPGKKVLVSPRWIKEVSWEKSELFVDLSRESIRNSPEYDHAKPVSPDYEGRLCGHYGRKNDQEPLKK